MRIKKIALQNFLSYERAAIELFGGLNFIEGENAAGKTNFAESAYFAAVGKSARNLKDKELVKWETDGARILITVEKASGTKKIDIYIDASGKKHIQIDGIPITKTGELLGALNVVYFSPDELRLIKESPSDRRRFLDIAISQRDKLYFYTLMRYNKLLTQRNKLLKNYKNSPEIKSLSDLVVGKMIESEVYIIKKRADFVSKLAPCAKENHAQLTGMREELSVVYEGDVIQSENAEAELKTLYDGSFEKDCRLEYTTVGIHRDDIKILTDGVDLRKFGSQGQQRTAVLSLKLAEIDFFKQEKKDAPVLILDDVMSELDINRQTALLKAVQGMQVILTGTDFAEITGRRFEVKNTGSGSEIISLPTSNIR